MDMSEDKKTDEKVVLEALIFASAEPVSVKTMYEHMQHAGYESPDIGAILKELERDYSGRGFALVQSDNLWAFRTRADVADALRLEKQVVKKMSRAALETMAIIAYHQPVTRAEIENIRGVATHKGTLDTLMEMEWIKPGRRRETPGRPLTWVTTPGFLDHFALEALTDLPGLDELKASGLLDRRPAIDAFSDHGDLFTDEEEEAIEEQDV